MKEILNILYYNYIGMTVVGIIFTGFITWIPVMVIDRVLVDEES